MNVEGLSNAEGKCEYTTDGCGQYTLAVSREGYSNYSKEMCISKTSLSNLIVPVIPIIPADNGTIIQLCLSGDATAKGLSFTIYCPLSNFQ